MWSGRKQDRSKTVPNEKREAAVERLKPLWLCGLDGGRWRTRTSYLVRVKQIDVDCKGLQGTFLRNRGPARTVEDWLGLTTVPKPSHELTPDKLPLGYAPVTWGELIRHCRPPASSSRAAARAVIVSSCIPTTGGWSPYRSTQEEVDGEGGST